MVEDPEGQHNVGLVSLGCAKALVDSEVLGSELESHGYRVVGEDESNIVVVNTCGFIESAVDESLDALDAVVAQGKRLVITGCLAARRDLLTARYPGALAIGGPADVDTVVSAVMAASPPAPGVTYEAVRVGLTPAHFAYLKVSEGCNHRCAFCIIPQLRGPLRSRPLPELIEEVERMVDDGVQEVAVIAQDTSAYGLDLGYPAFQGAAGRVRMDVHALAFELGRRVPWLRLHYVYPYPHVDRLVPLMADGRVLPYLDVPFQHASRSVLRAMRRPAAAERNLERLNRWREICPELAVRSTFIVGFPGETDRDFEELLDFIDRAELDRAGCFTYSDVDGAAANALDDQVEESVKLDRQEWLLDAQAEVSRKRLQRLCGTVQEVIVDGQHVDDSGRVQAFGRTRFDAYDVDGRVFVELQNTGLDRAPAAAQLVGARIRVHIDTADEHDLYGRYVGDTVKLPPA